MQVCGPRRWRAELRSLSAGAPLISWEPALTNCPRLHSSRLDGAARTGWRAAVNGWRHRAGARESARAWARGAALYCCFAWCQFITCQGSVRVSCEMYTAVRTKRTREKMERASCGRCGRAHNALVCHVCKSCALGMQFLLQTLAILKCPNAWVWRNLTSTSFSKEW